MNHRQALFALALLLSPTLAFAHSGHDHTGLLAGLSHPLLGLDHLLAMFAVGLWAAQQSGVARWTLPLTFVASMFAGGMLGLSAAGMPWLEGTIAASVLAFGLLVAVAARLPMAASLGLTALFALSHGIAHGLELPAQASPWAYASGFLIATAGLHAAAYALARSLPHRAAPLVRLAGVIAAVSGAWMLAG